MWLSVIVSKYPELPETDGNDSSLIELSICLAALWPEIYAPWTVLAYWGIVASPAKKTLFFYLIIIKIYQ